MSLAETWARIVVMRFGSPISCEGFQSHDGDYDCNYGGSIDCGDCCVNGGVLDPRTDRRFRWGKPHQPYMVWLQRMIKGMSPKEIEILSRKCEDESTPMEAQ